MNAAALVAALLALVPNSPAAPCLRARTASIAAAIAHAESVRGVPMGAFLAVGFLETHAGCHAAAYGGWGAPRDFRHRHVAGTADDAAAVLQHGLAYCRGDLERAVSFFRTGACTTTAHADYVARVLHLMNRLYDRAGLARPRSTRLATR